MYYFYKCNTFTRLTIKWGRTVFKMKIESLVPKASFIHCPKTLRIASSQASTNPRPTLKDNQLSWALHWILPPLFPFPFLFFGNCSLISKQCVCPFILSCFTFVDYKSTFYKWGIKRSPFLFPHFVDYKFTFYKWGINRSPFW